MLIVCAADVTVEVDAAMLAAATKSSAFKEIIEKAEEERLQGHSRIAAGQDSADAWRLVWNMVQGATPRELTWDTIPSVLRLADKYQLEGVLNTCGKLISSNLLHQVSHFSMDAPHNLGVPPTVQYKNFCARELMSLLSQLGMSEPLQQLYITYSRTVATELGTAVGTMNRALATYSSMGTKSTAELLEKVAPSAAEVLRLSLKDDTCIPPEVGRALLRTVLSALFTRPA